VESNADLHATEIDDFDEFDDFDDLDAFDDEIAAAQSADGEQSPIPSPDPPLRHGMEPQVVQQERSAQQRRQKRRQLNHTETLLAIALDGQDDRFKTKVYELVIEFNLEPDDPLFLVLVATGRLETLLDERPQELSALFDQWENRVHTQLGEYREGLEQYERTAVKAQEKAIAQSVHELIRRTTFEKFIHSFTVASVGLAAALALAATGLGGMVGYQFHAAQVRAIQYAPGKPRQLTLAEANALEWVSSSEGQQAKRLWEWNQDLLANYACEEQADQLGITLSLQGQLAERGACVLWVRPIEQRRLKSK